MNMFEGSTFSDMSKGLVGTTIILVCWVGKYVIVGFSG